MTSPRARPVLLALLCVLAIAVAAATLNSAVAVDGEVRFGSGDGLGTGSGTQAGPNGSSTTPGIVEGSGGSLSISVPCIPLLTDPQFLVAAGLVVLAGGYLLYRRKGLLLPIGVAAVAAPPVMLVYAVFTACGAAGETEDGFPLAGAGNDSSTFDLLAGNASSGGATGGLSGASLLLLLGIGVALVAAVALLFVSSDDQLLDDDDVDEDEPEPEPAPEAIGRAAGRAADRIEEDADLDNEVFRAWHEMTTYLDVPNPESSSPGEFADAAVDAGMAREDVSRLTRLFEDVRYGSAEATDEREQRAVDALRRIEAQYAGDEA